MRLRGKHPPPTAEKISVLESSRCENPRKWKPKKAREFLTKLSWRRPDLGKSRGSRASNNQGMGTITCHVFLLTLPCGPWRTDCIYVCSWCSQKSSQQQSVFTISQH